MHIAVEAAGTTHAAVRKEAVEDPWMPKRGYDGFHDDSGLPQALEESGDETL